MKLDASTVCDRYASRNHGVLATLHPENGVDIVPVVYSVDTDGYIGVPVDRVKPKASGLLQRELNLHNDPRATLLIEEWDDSDWSRLWWVRCRLKWLPNPATARIAALADSLEKAYQQYEDQPFDRILVFEVCDATGWSAQPPSQTTTQDETHPAHAPGRNCERQTNEERS